MLEMGLGVGAGVGSQRAGATGTTGSLHGHETGTSPEEVPLLPLDLDMAGAKQVQLPLDPEMNDPFDPLEPPFEPETLNDPLDPLEPPFEPDAGTNPVAVTAHMQFPVAGELPLDPLEKAKLPLDEDPLDPLEKE